MPDKIRESTGLKIVEVLKKGNLNFKTNLVDRTSDQKLDEILDEAVRQWRDEEE